jgi:hypothetical protein
MSDEHVDLGDYLRRRFVGLGMLPDDDEYDPTKYEPDRPITAQKIGHTMIVSDELLMDEGLIEDTRPTPPLRRRVKWKMLRRVTDARLAIGSWIAGVELRDFDDE